MLWMEYPQIALPYSLGNGKETVRVGRNAASLASDHAKSAFPVQDPIQDLSVANELMSQ